MGERGLERGNGQRKVVRKKLSHLLPVGWAYSDGLEASRQQVLEQRSLWCRNPSIDRRKHLPVPTGGFGLKWVRMGRGTVHAQRGLVWASRCLFGRLGGGGGKSGGTAVNGRPKMGGQISLVPFFMAQGSRSLQHLRHPLHCRPAAPRT